MQEYLQGATPKELAEKYKLTPKQITNKASRDKWVTEKETIQDKTRQNLQSKIQELLLYFIQFYKITVPKLYQF